MTAKPGSKVTLEAVVLGFDMNGMLSLEVLTKDGQRSGEQIGVSAPLVNVISEDPQLPDPDDKWQDEELFR